MKRLSKILPKESIIPEFKYLVFSAEREAMIAWNGQAGIAFHISKVPPKLQELVQQYGQFAIMDGRQFLRIVTAMDKVDKVTLDKSTSMLTMQANGGKVKVELTAVMDLPDETPHLAIDFNTTKGVNQEITPLWFDTVDLITKEGAALWDNITGVYESSEFLASFDYGVLLYHEKETPDGSSVLYCPQQLLEIGMKGMERVSYWNDMVLMHGDGVTYFSSPRISTDVLTEMLILRELARTGKERSVALDFTPNLWKRAKLFSKSALDMHIRGGQIILSNNEWKEVIGTTDAPDAHFVTRISLLSRWTVGTLGHKIRITEDGSWYLYGKTRKGTEFYGSLTMIGGAPEPEQEYVDVEAAKVDEDVDVGSLL